MDQPEVKSFHSNITSSTCYNNSNRSNNTTSCPFMSLPNSRPVQVESEGDSSCGPGSLLANGNVSVSESLSSKISFLAPKKKESTASEPPSHHIHAGSLMSEVPKLETATSLSRLDQESEEKLDQQSPSASLSKNLFINS